MRTRLALIATLSLFAATPVMAGNLTFNNGQTAWNSTQCNKPNSPPSVYNAHPETEGENMNGLVSQHNAFVNDAQNYMNCISSEAEKDQSLVSQAIAANAQHMISQMQDEVNADAQNVRNSRNNGN